MTAPTRETERDPVVRIAEWVKRNLRALIASGAVVIAGAAITYYFIAAGQRREAYADRELTDARRVLTAGNRALAATDLQLLVTTHAGTIAADEAAILLARIRAEEGQPAQAVAVLTSLVDRGPHEQFIAPAYGLLGSAHEELGNLAEAARAYRSAAEGAWYEFLKAQYLIDAARVLAAIGDTAQAVTVYREILTDLAESQIAVEARLRLAEIERGDIEAGVAR